MFPTKKLLLTTLICGPALLLSACNDSDSDGEAEDRVIATGLPEGLSLSFVDASDGAFYSYDTTTGRRVDLNAKAAASEDESIQEMQLTDVSLIGSFLVWPDSGEHAHEADQPVKMEDEHDHEHEEGELEAKYLLMVPGYERGAPIDADDFSVIVHFHDEDLAGHSAEEYREAEDGSNLAEELERLNHFVEEQAELFAEVEEALTAEGRSLCVAYVDPYLAAEHAHEEEHAGDTLPKNEEAHAGEEHGELVHYALDTTGRVYFFEEHMEGLETIVGGFVRLEGTSESTVLDCSRSSIARANEEGVLVFLPDTQMIYQVDSHDGGDFHQHGVWTIDAILPAGTRADLVAIVGAGEEHDHDHAE